MLAVRCSWMRCCFSGYIAGTDGYYGASHDIPAADRPVGIIRWGRAGVLVIYSAEVVECIGYQKNILDICPFVAIRIQKDYTFINKK